MNDNFYPYAFFPHSYDGINNTRKTSKYLHLGDESVFKRYFSESLNSVESKRLLQYMIDGGFFDDQTHEVSVEFITLNSNVKVFAKYVFTFTWEVRPV